MADRAAARLPLTYGPDSPEPTTPIRLRCTCCTCAWSGKPLQPWQRIGHPHPGAGDYRWFNGDKLRTWPMLTHNHGPLVNVDRLSRIRAAYRRRNRRG